MGLLSDYRCVKWKFSIIYISCLEGFMCGFLGLELALHSLDKTKRPKKILSIYAEIRTIQS